jgi:hypothetical protein
MRLLLVGLVLLAGCQSVSEVKVSYQDKKVGAISVSAKFKESE